MKPRLSLAEQTHVHLGVGFEVHDGAGAKELVVVHQPDGFGHVEAVHLLIGIHIDLLELLVGQMSG